MTDHSSRIAIIGMAGRFPGAATVDELWRALIEGREGVRFFSREELIAAGVPATDVDDPSYVPSVGYLDGADHFDAEFFGYSAREGERLDPQQRLFLECAWASIEHAGHTPDSLPARTGVYAGVGFNTYLLNNILPQQGLLHALDPLEALVSSDKDYAALRTAFDLDLRGPAVNVQSTCSTSLVAVHLACQSLLSAECDAAIAGGSSVLFPLIQGYKYVPGTYASPDGHCRPYDRRGQGTITGSAVAAVLLKRLEDALADGDRVHAVIAGSAINNDGRRKPFFSAPSVEGQAAVLREALELAGVAPAEVGMIEGHGTGTNIGDPIETRALLEVYADPARPVASCALGSIKSNIGHTNATAGVAGLIKAVLAVEHGVVPPTLHFEAPNPGTGLEGSLFFVPREATPFPDTGGLRRAGVSAFGIGGTNAHVIVEQAPPRPTRAPTRPSPQTVTVSARSPQALARARAALAAHLTAHPDLDPADVAYTTQVGRRAFAYRAAVVGRTLDELRAGLGDERPEHTMFGVARPQATTRAKRVAFIYTGAGGEHAGMGRELYRTEPVFRRVVDQVSSVAEPLIGAPIARWIDGELAVTGDLSTPFSHAAMLAIHLGLTALWRAYGVEPVAAMGHSLGEFAAACAAGVLGVEDTVRLALERARLLATRTPPGCMAVTLVPEADVRARAARAGLHRVFVAAVNGDANTVISGEPSEVHAAMDLLRAEGAEVELLRIGVASHCPLMDEAAGALREVAAGYRFQAPRGPTLVSSLTGAAAGAGDMASADYWWRHLLTTVRFADALRALPALGVEAYVELGPSAALLPLMRAALGPTVEAYSSLKRGADARVHFHDLRGALAPPPEARRDDVYASARRWVAGGEVDFTAQHAGADRARVALPTYPFEPRRLAIDPPAPVPAAAPALERRAEVARWLYTPSWAQCTPEPAPAELSQHVLVLAGAAVRAPVAAWASGERSIDVVLDPDAPRTAEPWPAGVLEHRVAPEDPAAWRALLSSLRQAGRAPTRIVDASLLGPAVADAWPEAHAAFARLVMLARALLAEELLHPIQLDVLTRGLFDVVGDEALVPERAVVIGPARVLPQELTSVTCRLVDVDGAAAAHLAHLVLGERGAGLFAQRGRHRFTLRTAAAPTTPTPPPHVRAKATVVVVGGLGGVGASLAESIAEAAGGGRVALLSRQAHVEPRASEVRSRLERVGAEVLLLEADVTDRASLDAALATVRSRWGAIHAAVHAAGAAHVFWLQDAELARADALLASKVHGGRNLLAALADDRPDFVVLCGSLAAVTGAPGHTDYVAANAVLAAYAHRARARQGLPVTTVDWEIWRGLGMSERMGVATALFAEVSERGIHRAAEGAEALARALSTGQPEVVVSAVDLDARIAEMHAATRGGALPDAGARPQRQRRPDIDTPYAPTEGALERDIARAWEDLLGYDGLGADDRFVELGGDSLTAARLTSRLRRDLSVDLPLGAVLEAQTIRHLGAKIARIRGQTTAAPAAAAPPAAPAPAAPWTDHPLSIGQERIVFFHELDPGSPAYNMSAALHLEGPLEPAALAAALEVVTEHHEALRTTLVREGGRTVQRVHARLRLPLEVVDRRGTPLDADTARAEAALEARRPFELRGGPLARVRLARHARDHSLLSLTLHHAVGDGASLAIVLEDVGRALTERAPRLSASGRFTEFAAEQRRALEAGRFDERRARVLSALAGAPEALRLPLDRPRPRVQTFRGGTVRRAIDARATAALEQLARREGAGMYALALAAYGALLARWSGDDEVLIGSPAANRLDERYQRTVGLFANTLVLRLAPGRSTTWRALLAEASRTAQETTATQEVPFEALLDTLRPRADVGHLPIFQVVLFYERAPSSLPLGPARARPIAFELGTSVTDLALAVSHTPEGLRLQLDYAADLFERDTAQALVDELGGFLEGLAVDAEAAWRELAARPSRRAQRADRSPASLERALASDPSLLEAVVRARGGRRVAYVVPGSPRWTPPEGWDIEAWVRLSALPLAADGAVDEVTLEAVPVLDASVAARAEQALPPGAAAAVVRPRSRRAPLYLWDLLERPRRADAHGGGRADARADTPRDQGPLALLDGGPLPLLADDPRTLVEALDRAAEGRCGVAFASRGGSVEVGYAALRAAALRVAGGLDAAGIAPGEALILQLDDLRGHFEAFWAGALSGRPPLAVAIPPSYAEPSAAMDRLRSAWTLLRRPAVIAPRRRVAELSAGLPGARVLALEDLAACPTDGRRAVVRPEDVLMLQLTSGSTGTSKAVEITHRAVVAHCVGSRALFGDGPTDVFLSWLSVDHVVPIVTLHLKAVFHGAAQVQAVAAEILADLLAMLDLVERHRVTFTWMPNFCFKLVADKVAATPERRWDLSSLRVWLNGGEQVTLPVIRGFVDRLAPFGFPEDALRPGYGMAELATAVTYQRRFDRERVANRFLTSSLGGRLVRTEQDGAHVTTLVHVGGVAPGVQVRIADAEDRVLPEGYIGRVQVRGPVVTPGYRNQPEATRAARTRDDWFDTGDQGFVLDRELTISGREKELIIVRGANILPQDIEQVVAELDGVDPTSPAAVGVENERTGTEDVAVFFVPTSAGRARLTELLRQVRERVAARVGVSPAVIVPLAPAQLPRTSVGKIQRTQLKADLRRGEFDAVLREVDVALESPERTIPDWFAEPVWQRRSAPPRALRPRGRAAVIAHGEQALARAVATHLSAAGDTVSVLDAALTPDATADYQRLFYLVSAGAPERALDAAAECAGFARALSWLAEGRTEAVVVATMGGQRLHPAEAALPGRMALGALARTAGIERSCRVTAVDLDPRGEPAEHAAQLAAEEAGVEAEVSYRGEARWVRRFRRIDVSSAPRAPLCRAGDLVLITGGAGGVGRELTEALRARGVHVAWVGRTPRAALSREATEALATTAPGALAYAEVDVDDERALPALVAALEAERGAPLAGVLHLAGAWAQRPLAEESARTFAEALAPKLARGLGAVLTARPQAFAVAASSVYAAFGAAGVGAYAAGGRALEAMPWLDGPRRGVLRMSYWDGVGVSRGFMGHATAAQRGMDRVSSGRGAASVLALLDRGLTAGFVGLDLTGQPWAVGEPCARDALTLFAETGAGDAPRPRQVQVDDALGRAITVPVEWRRALPRRDGTIDRATIVSDAEGASAHQAPRDDLERLLAGIWSAALAVPSVSVRDSFFELGGHSLLAVRVLSEVSAALGRDVPVAYLFESPTIEALAERLRTHATAAWSPLVRLGAAAGADAPTLCLVHAGGGLVHPYEPLARALGPRATVLGLQARGLAEGQVPHDSIAAMAAEYAQALQREHPAGELVLGGWSLGSVVALEMTALLGDRVRALALIDPIPLDTAPPAFDASDDDTLTRTARDAGLPVEQLAGLSGDALFDRFLALVNASPLVGGGVGRAQLERFIAYSRAAHRAVAAYRPRTTRARTALITATRGLLDEAAVARWRQRLTGEVTRHTIAGTHESIVVGEGAAELVRALASALGR